jgi:hypothetical protein
VSYKLSPTEDHQLHVSLDKPGVAAVSETFDPLELIVQIVDVCELDPETVTEVLADAAEAKRGA